MKTQPFIDAVKSLSSAKVHCSASHRIFLLLIGILLILVGFLILSPLSLAQSEYYNDEAITKAARILLAYMHGSLGALIMIIAGLSAIVGAAFGSYRAALGLLIVALIAFTLPSFISTFFDAEDIVNGP